MTHSAFPRRLRLQIADELERVREEIERLGAILCSDPALIARHVAALQALDVIGQQQMAFATLLRADDPQAAIGETPLEQLRARLEQALEPEDMVKS